jgi:hypothetical protein
MEHAPGPRGSPQLPQAPEEAGASDELFAETAKTDSCGVSCLLLLQVGQTGFSLPNTRASNRWSHPLQMYSKIGMTSIGYTKVRMPFYSSDLISRSLPGMISFW